MTVLYSVATNDVVAAADVNQFKNMLEGASNYTSTYALKSTAGTNFTVTLGDTAGNNKLSIKDSAGVEVAYIDSDGAFHGSISLGAGTLTFPTSANPTPTTEGQAIWDTDDNILSVGDGAASKLLIPSPTTTAGDLEYASGARAHSRLAIGTAGQVLTVNAGATAPTWTNSVTYKWTAATQTVSASTTFVDVVAVGSPATMAFTPTNGGIYRVEYDLPMTFTGSGGGKWQITGGTATAISIRSYAPHDGQTAGSIPIVGWAAAVTAFSTPFAAQNASGAADGVYYSSVNGGNMKIIMYFASTSTTAVTLQFAQNSANATSVIGIGAMMKVETIN